MRRILTLLIGVLVLAASAKAQNFNQLLEWGDENFADGDFYGASLYYERAMLQDSIDIHLLWKYAESLRLYNDYAKAEYYYAKVYKKERGKIYPLSAFHLATMHKYNGDYRNAIKIWKKYNRKYKRQKDSYEYKKSQQDRQSCIWARDHVNDSVDVKVSNVGKPVNSEISEFGAYPLGDKLFYSSLRAKETTDMREVLDDKYYIKVYSSDSSSAGWEKGKELPNIINAPNKHVANICFNADGSKFYFTQCDNNRICGIYMSNYDGSKWSDPVELSEINEKDFTVTQPMVTNVQGKEVLFFASNMQGGKGKMDIWFVTLKNGIPDGAPKNAGDNINTPDNEISPYYDSTSGSLYFSSEWHNGYGGFDIFEVKGRLGDFSYPINIGKPFNSRANDYYFSINAETGKGFLTSNRVGSLYKKSPTCCNDIWQFEYPERTDTLPYSSLEDLNKFLPVTLYFHNDRPDPRTRKDSTAENYIDTYQRYIGMKNEYVSENRKDKSGDAADDAEEEISDFFTYNIQKGVSDLNVFSKLLLIELDKGQEVELTIQGFASPIAKTDYNVHLTRRRITSLINYLYDYDGGVYKKYLEGTAANGGRLSFNKIAYGEYTADTLVTDDRSDAESVFSTGASKERKIQIISVKQAKRDSTFAEMSFVTQIFDFGKRTQGDSASATFTFINTGNQTLEVDSIYADCDCIVTSIDNNIIEPGNRGTIRVQLNTANQLGLIAKHITITSNGVPSEKQLSITSEVFKKP